MNQDNRKFHKLLERQLKKWLPGYPDIPPAMQPLFQSITESYFHHDSDRLLVENAIKESSDELTSKRQQLKSIYDQQTLVINSLRDAVSRLLPEHHLDMEDDLLKIADVLREIIDQKAIAESLKEQSEQRLLSILDNLQLGMVEYDMSGKLSKVQSNFATMFGYDPSRLIGKNSDFFMIGDYHLKDGSMKFDFLLHNDLFEAQMKKCSGETFWLLCTTTPVYDSRGCQNGGVMIVFDITGQKKLESELRQARRAAEAGLEIRKTILSNVSHELRTPVNAIAGMSYLLSSTKLDTAQQEYIETLKFSSESLLVLIDDLLDVSRIESGNVELERIAFSMQKILYKLSRSLGLKAEEKGLKFEYHIDPSLCEFLFGDLHRLNQILMNLISNAIKFTHQGKIILSVSVESEQEHSQMVRISVRDTGIGIAADRLNAVFQEFSQEDASTTRRYGGTGLGLTISRKLVEMMGSKLKVESEKNIGSDFYFTVSLEKSETPEAKQESFNPDLSGVSILIVEDNPVNQYLAATLLKTWNAHVEICNNGLLAIQSLRERNFNIILMDLQMPVKDGFETTLELRQKLKDNTPVIALTANALSGERDACLAVGMNDYISKPFQPENLYKKILIHMGNSAGRICA